MNDRPGFNFKFSEGSQARYWIHGYGSGNRAIYTIALQQSDQRPEIDVSYEDVSPLKTLWYPRSDSYGFQSWYLSVPFWIPTVVFSGLLCSLYGVGFLRRRKRKKLGLCIQCGYDLRASKERCPECGEEFSN